MKRLLFQLGYTACVVSLGAALAVVLWSPAFSQGVKADRLDIQSPLPQAKPDQPTPAPPFRCGPLQEMRKVLKKRFGEQVSGRGLTNSSEAAALEIYTSKEGTWTILLTSADGVGCVVAAGKYWSDVKHEIPGMDS